VVWTFIAALNDSLSNFGLIVIGVFVSCWLLSVAIYRWRGYDNLVTEQGQCE
jgi:high-affinity nickel-transport protein